MENEELQDDAPEQDIPVESDAVADDNDDIAGQDDIQPEADPQPQEDEVDWKERAMRAEKAIEASKRKEKDAKKGINPPKLPSPQPVDAPIGDINAVLARLENRGVMDSNDQNYVLRYAKAEGISPVDALQDEVVKDRLAYNKKQREQKAASPPPGNRTGTLSGRTAAYYADKGVIPTDPKLAEEVQALLAKRAREGA